MGYFQSAGMGFPQTSRRRRGMTTVNIMAMMQSTHHANQVAQANYMNIAHQMTQSYLNFSVYNSQIHANMAVMQAVAPYVLESEGEQVEE